MQFFRGVKNNHHTKLAQSAKQTAVTIATAIAAHSGYKHHGSLTSTNTIGSAFVLKQDKVSGLWLAKKAIGAYADPPYPGQAHRHYSHDPKCAEVDYKALIRQLNEKYDGWALSTSSTSLRAILALCPEDVRIGVWVKPFSSYKKANPAYTWEPVIFKSCRTRKGRFVVRDYVAANITLKRGLCGVKPDRFCYWLFEILGMEPEDEFVDLFPGSGAVTRAWEAWKARELRRRITGEPFGLYVQKKDSAPIAH